MILVIHITVAIISVVSSLLTVLAPTHTKQRATQFLTLATLMTGAIMVAIQPTHLGKSCISGILYIGFITLASSISKRKLTIIKQNNI